MEKNNQAISASSQPGQERRAHPRYPVSLPVEIIIEKLGQFSGEARDFCMGGLLIMFEPDLLPDDTQIEGNLSLITFKIDGDEFRMRARIVRTEASSIGVAFMNPDHLALQALKQHAEIDAQPVTSGDQPLSAQSEEPVESDRFVQILKTCNKKTKAFIKPILDQFVEQLNDNLFEAAKSEEDINLQNTLFKTLDLINSNKQQINTTFSSSVISSLNTNKQLTIVDKIAVDEDVSAASLELISDEEFDVWLANSKITNKVEAEYPQLIGGLERRLSHLYNQTVDRRNNPFAPNLFVGALEKTIEALELDDSVKIYCYDSFRNVLVPLSEQIYRELNQILIDNGILPDLKQLVIHARKNRDQQQDAVQESEEHKLDEEIAKEQSTDESVPAHEDSKRILSESEKNQPKTVSGEVIPQNLYELVGEIRHLQHQLSSAASGHVHGSTENSAAGQLVTTENVPALPSYSTSEVLDVISSLKLPAATARGDGQSIAAFREALSKQLEETNGGNADKALSQQQGRVIDVTENVFTSLLNDMQVASSVRPWLEQLAVPVMKMALLDENIFTDKNHVVRNVINKLAELEVLASAEDEEEQAAVRQAFNWVINLVNTEFDGTTKAYIRASQQLDLLISVQQQSFEKNLKQVVAEAIREELDSAESQSNTEQQEQESAESQWLRMARRLMENHWVLFDANSDDPKRLKVAWIAPRKGKYIFVNVMGRKDRIATDLELAELLETGSAVLLDGTDDPAMDRAQYSMLQKLHKQLLFQSTHDELTGLINRREFLNCMQHALQDAKLSKNKHAVCYIDVDDFKVINTNYGYEAGDKLLHEMIEQISKQLKEHNVVARIGSDTFGLLLQKTSMDDAVEIIEDIMDRLDDYRFEWGDDRISVKISTGVAIVNTKTESAESLLQAAESSCGIAKESGGNQIQIASTGSGRLSRRQKEMEWATKIDKAIDENGLFLRCQKIAAARPDDNHLPHYEILLGISDQLGGNKSLADFIQAAEQHNRMVAVDRWVIENAFNWLSRNEDMVSDVSMFSINLSGQSLNNEDLIDFIYNKVSQGTVPIEKVCFEVTETAGVTNLSDTADFIETIKGTGCKFSLDDFGTGMSSYSYLKSLPVDYLKIDGTFITDIANNRNDFAVVKSICEIGHFMEKKVIAEFVQDEQSATILRNIGVDYLQGFGIEKPHELDKLLQ